MAYIEPNTQIDLLSGIPFDPDYENTMYFASVADQNSYFDSKVVRSIPKNSYQRVEKGVMRVGWVADTLGDSVIETLYKSGYMRFKNTNFENKWFYAFIDKVEYVNNNTVTIVYHLDEIQTWLFDFTFNQCLIERSHTASDVFGQHTIPENIETGPYKAKKLSYLEDGTQHGFDGYEYTPVIVLVTTFDAQGNYAPGGLIHGMGSHSWGDMYSGLHYYWWNLDQTGIDAVNQTLEAISGGALATQRNLIDGVVALFMGAKEFIESGFNSVINPTHILGLANPTDVDGYTPRNKKLLCYPYNLLYVTNNQGNAAEYRWEEFELVQNTYARLGVWGSTSINQGMSCAPFVYKGVQNINHDEQITLTGFPMCAWSNDSFKAWVAQNAGTILAGAGTLAVGWINAASNPVSRLVNDPFAVSGGQKYLPGDVENTASPVSGGLFAATMGAIGQMYDHIRKPPQSHGNGNGSLQYQNGLLTFSFYQKYIKQEYAIIADKFFDMYGYKINAVGVPNLAVRPCYTFIKTVGCSIESDLPVDDVLTIQRIFDKGIRFWKTTATFGSFDPAVNNNAV